MTFYSRIRPGFGPQPASLGAPLACGVGMAGDSGPSVPAVPQPYLGQVVTRARIAPGALTDTTRQIMSQRGYVAKDAFSSFQIVICNWYVDGSFTEATLGATLSVDASVFSGGVWVPILFSGSATGTVADGGQLVSDVCTINPVAIGDTVLVRLWKRYSAGGCIIIGGGPQNTNFSDLCAYGATTPNCCDGTAFTQTDTNTNDSVQGLIALTSKPSAFIFGTSRGVGAGDTEDASGDMGEMARVFGYKVAYINASRSSDSLQNAVSNYSKRQLLAQYCSYGISDHGTNDEFNSRTLLQIQTNMATLIGILRPLLVDHKVYWMTPVPRTNAGNSATQTGEAVRLTRDAWLRGGADGIVDGLIDARYAMENTDLTGLWRATAWTADGVHESQAGNLQIGRSVAIPSPILVRTGTASWKQTDALVSAFTTPPTSGRLALIDTLMRSLVNSGVFELLDTFYMFCAADAQAAYLNWIKPGTFTAVNVGSPTFTADRGVQGDGASTLVSTTFNPSGNGVNYQRNRACIGVVATTDDSNAGSDCGASTGVTASVQISLRNAGNLAGRINRFGTNISVANGDARCCAVLVRDGGSSERMYKDGAQVVTGSDASVSPLPNHAIYVCGANNDTTNYATRQIGCHFAGANLSAAQIATLAAAVKAYINGCTPGLLP